MCIQCIINFGSPVVVLLGSMKGGAVLLRTSVGRRVRDWVSKKGKHRLDERDPDTSEDG